MWRIFVLKRCSLERERSALSNFRKEHVKVDTSPVRINHDAKIDQKLAPIKWDLYPWLSQMAIWVPAREAESQNGPWAKNFSPTPGYLKKKIKRGVLWGWLAGPLCRAWVRGNLSFLSLVKMVNFSV